MLDSSRKHLNAVPNLSPRVLFKSQPDHQPSLPRDRDPARWDGLGGDKARPRDPARWEGLGGDEARPRHKGDLSAGDDGGAKAGADKDVVAGESDRDSRGVVGRMEEDSNPVLPVREKLRRSRVADSAHLNKMAAIDLQNSLAGQRKVRPRRLEQELQLADNKADLRGDKQGMGGGGRKVDLPGGGRFRKALDERNLGMESRGGVERGGYLEKKQQKLSSLSGGVDLGEFEQEAYLGAQRMRAGEGDKMKKFQFNQVASDATPPDRFLRDYRNPQ